MGVVYGGFWRRFVAMLIDVALAFLLLFPLVRLLGISDEAMISGSLFAQTRQVMLNIPSIIAATLFLYYRSATPGKLIMDLRVVDADTLGPLSIGQALGRQLAYILSLFLFLGFIWIAFSRQRRGWHDLLAGTVVIRHSSSPGLPGPRASQA
jgi:uncharacterized RDD family membrane protein YckC